MSANAPTTLPTVAVVVVTYSSGRVLQGCLSALGRQTRPADAIVVVDNASPDPGYLDAVDASVTPRIVRNPANAGFCGGNNIGYRLVRNHKYVLFLNPDAFPAPDLLEKAVSYMERPESQRVGALTGTLLGFDIATWRPTGKIDSLGVFQTWYGRWHDRGQGQPWGGSASSPAEQDLPAACGALMLCRTAALEDVQLSDGEIFDERFFMYKEDIDLSLRLRKKAWKVRYVPDLICYHGRGWQSRSRMPLAAKYWSARNELRVCLRHSPRGLPFTLAKYAVVGAQRIASLIEARLRWRSTSRAS